MSVRKSLFQSFTTKYLVLIVQFATTMVLARLLTPGEIGIYSIAAVVAALTQVLREFGIGQFIVQEKELTRDKIRAAFTISLGLNWLVGGLLYLITDVVADFYQQPGIAEVLNILVITFIISPIASIPVALMRRHMQFNKIMRIEVFSAIAHATTGITAAYMGESYMALGWASLAGVSVTLLAAFIQRPADTTFLPGFSKVRDVASYGAIAGGAALIGQVSFQIPDLVIGKALTMHAVGIFGKALSTIMLFNKVIVEGLVPVFLSHFAKAHREGKNLNEAYFYVVSCLTVISWPFFLFMAVNAEDLVLLLYGNQWYEAVIIVQIMCVSMIVFSFTSLVEHIFTAIGQIKEVLRLQVFTAITRIVIVLSAAPFGLEAIALALIAIPVLRLFVVFPKLKKHMSITASDHFPLLKICFITTLPCALVLALQVALLQMVSVHYFIMLLISGAVYSLTWITSIFYFNHPIKKEVETVYLGLKAKYTSAS